MAYFKISEPNKPIKWIKDVDSANGTLTFQKSRDGAHFEDEGFFAESEMDYIKFHFKEKYPELGLICTFLSLIYIKYII